MAHKGDHESLVAELSWPDVFIFKSYKNFGPINVSLEVLDGMGYGEEGLDPLTIH